MSDSPTNSNWNNLNPMPVNPIRISWIAVITILRIKAVNYLIKYLFLHRRCTGDVCTGNNKGCIVLQYYREVSLILHFIQCVLAYLGLTPRFNVLPTGCLIVIVLLCIQISEQLVWLQLAISVPTGHIMASLLNSWDESVVSMAVLLRPKRSHLRLRLIL